MSASLRSLKGESLESQSLDGPTTAPGIVSDVVVEVALANRQASESLVRSDIELVAEVKAGSR